MKLEIFSPSATPSRDVYSITEKGRALLQALDQPRFPSPRKRKLRSLKEPVP